MMNRANSIRIDLPAIDEKIGKFTTDENIKTTILKNAIKLKMEFPNDVS